MKRARQKHGWAALGLAALSAAGCATVKNSKIRDDYEKVDKHQVKRLSVAVVPLPDGNAKAGELFSLVARRYVNQKRDFIVKENSGQPGSFEWRSFCTEGIEGVLWIAPHVQRQGAGMEASADAKLLRCRDGEPVWTADAGGSWDSEDSRLVETTKSYVEELGPEVQPYVAPAFNLLRPLLDTLPQPALNEADKDEKIELGE
jgi:probable lipoprotein (TIGR04455 family)